MLTEVNRTAAGTMTAWWIISRVWGGRIEAMTVPRGGGRDLAVFGHEEEAQLFLWSLGPGQPGDGWRVGETRCGELASLLCGPCRGVRGVALDPLPEMLEDGTVALVGIERGTFLARLLGPGRRLHARPDPRPVPTTARRHVAPATVTREEGTGPQGDAREIRPKVPYETVG